MSANVFTPLFDPSMAQQADLSLMLLWAVFGDVITFLLQGMGVLSDSEAMMRASQELGMLSSSFAHAPLSLGGEHGVVATFNTGGLFLGSIFFFFIAVFGIWNTASDGVALGAKWNSKNTVLRTMGALSMLIPGSYGYNALQMFILTIAISSCGLATLTWQAFVSSTLDREVDNMIISAVNHNRSSDALINSIYNMSMCAAGYGDAMAQLNDPDSRITFNDTVKISDLNIDANLAPSLMSTQYNINSYDVKQKNETMGVCGSANVEWNIRKNANLTAAPGKDQAIVRTIFSSESAVVEEMADKMRTNAGCILMLASQTLTNRTVGGCALDPATQGTVMNAISSLKTEFDQILKDSIDVASNPDSALILDSAAPINPTSPYGIASGAKLQKLSNGIDQIILKSYGQILKDSLIGKDASKSKIVDSMSKYGWLSSMVMSGRMSKIRDEIRNSTSLTKTYRITEPQWDFPTQSTVSDVALNARDIMLRYKKVALTFATINQAGLGGVDGDRSYKDGARIITSQIYGEGSAEAKSAQSMICGISDPFNSMNNSSFESMGREGKNNFTYYIQHAGATLSSSIASQLAQGGADPLLQIKSAGDCIVSVGEILLLSGPVVKAFLETKKGSWAAQLAATAADAATLGSATGLQFLAESFVSIYSAILPLLYALLGAGFIMAYFLPMMPFIIVSLSVVGWLICVLEAIFACVLWAVMHFSPGGDTFMGSQEKGYLLLMSVFMRPVLIVVGLCSGLVLLYPVSWLIGNFFSIAVSSTQEASLVTGIAGLIAFLYIYIVLMYQAIKLCLGLPQTLPTEVMAWVGSFVKDFGETNATNTASGMISSAGSGAAGGAARSAGSGLAAYRNNQQQKAAQTEAAAAKANEVERHKQKSTASNGTGGGSSSPMNVTPDTGGTGNQAKG